MAEVEKNNNRISTSTIDIIDVDSPAIAASFSKKKDIVENYFTKPTTVRIVEENRHSYNEDDSPTATRFRTASKTQHPLSLPTDDHVDTTSDVETPTVDTPIDDLLLTPDQNPQAENSEYVRNFFQLPETEHLLEGTRIDFYLPFKSLFVHTIKLISLTKAECLYFQTLSALHQIFSDIKSR